MALSEEALLSARERLSAEVGELEKELVVLGASPDGSFEVSLDEGFADAAHATSERARVLSLVESLHTRLQDVHAALARLNRGDYGACERCGNDIPAERLDAVPTARLCMTCAQKR